MSKQYVKCLTDEFSHAGVTKGKLYEVLDWNADGFLVQDLRHFTIENDSGHEDIWWLHPDEFELVEKPTKKRSVKPLTEYEQRYILDRPDQSSRSLAKQLWGENGKRKSSINDFRKRVKQGKALEKLVSYSNGETTDVGTVMARLKEKYVKEEPDVPNTVPRKKPSSAKKRAEEPDNSRILLISDMHIPYHHPDTVEFLQHLKEKYNPTLVVCLGDELDKHALSYHDSDPDLPSAGDELRMSLPVIAQLHELFPRMDILDSNHGSLVWRKAKTHGIPKHYIKSYRDVLEVDEGWTWHYDMTLDLPNGQKVYLCHGKMSDITKMSQQMGMCAVAGHYHQSYKIEYWGNSFQLYWGLQAGCLIDDKSLAFAYNNTNLKRPVIGTGLIIDGQPILEPLLMGDDGRWVGRKK